MSTNIQRIGGKKPMLRGSGGEGNNDRTTSVSATVSPLESLRSQKREEFSCSDCLFKGFKCLFDFTIASCDYTFCRCLRSRRRDDYQNLELSINENDDDSVQISGDSVENEIEIMKAKLRFHFMNPFQKWKNPARRRFPWKLLTQLLALVVVTTQLYINATQKFQLNSFVSQNVDTFEKLFVKNPQPADPTVDYYQSSAYSVIITKDQFWDQLNYTTQMYYSIRKKAVGPFGYGWQNADDFNIDADPPPLKLKVEHYLKGNFTPEIKQYTFQGHKNTSTFNVSCDSDIQSQLDDTILTKEFDSIISLSFEFSLSSVYLDAQSSPLCCEFDITLSMKNQIHSGSMPVTLSTETTIEGCSHASSYDPATGIYDPDWTTAINCVVLVLMIISTIQCIRSIFNAGKFTKQVRSFFRKHYEYKLSLTQYLPLYNLWFIGVVVSNIFVMIGTVLYIVTSYTETHHLEVDDIVAIIYGMGVFLQWWGLLRFLSYFDKYNILLITLRLALPSVLRFMVCGFIFYIAFLLLGWLVLSPYHPKFRDPSVTSECLFSLINGDDMFNTYIQMENISLPAFIFSKIYLYIFISLFIYVVLSVFISLISDTYETLHEEWTVRSKGLLWDFAHDRPNKKEEAETQFELLTGSMYSNDGTPIITNGGPLLSHVAVTHSNSPNTRRTHRRETPTLNLPLSNPGSPRVPNRTRSLYPDLDGSSTPKIVISNNQ